MKGTKKKETELTKKEKKIVYNVQRKKSIFFYSA